MIHIKALFLIGLITLSINSYAQVDSLENKKSFMWIGITGGIGGEVVKDVVSPIIKLDLRLMKEEKYKIRLGTQINYFFEEGLNNNFNTFINTFISSEYLIFNKKEKDWNGLGFGYLIKNHGNYYGENTFKITFIKSIKTIEIKGELIFIDNFKSVFPGFSITFGIN